MISQTRNIGLVGFNMFNGDWTLYLGLLNEFYPTGKVLTISVYFVAVTVFSSPSVFAPNKSATLLLGAMNNASIPFNTLLNVAVKAALGAPR